MADIKKTIEVIFAGTDELSGKIGKISGGLNDFSGKVQGATQPLADFSSFVLKTEAALAAMAVGGLVLAINESGKFGDSFNEISTLIDGTDESINSFKGDLVNYATTSTQSLESINTAVYSAISAGTNYKDVIGSLSTAEKLAVASKTDLNSAMLLLVSTLNAYGEGSDSAAKYADILFKTVKTGQTTLPELSNALANVTSIAASAGVPFDTLAAAIAAVTATGMPTAQAITSIRAAIATIIKPTEDAKKVAAELGIQFNASALQTKGFEGVLQDVYTATGGNIDVIGRLFTSVESLPAVMTLSADTAGKFKNALNETSNAAGAVEEAYQKMSDNFNLINQNLSNNVKAALIALGDEMQDEYGGLASGLSEIFKGIKVEIDKGTFDPIISVFEGIMGDLSALFADVAKNLPEALADEAIDWTNITAAIENLVGNFGDLFEALFGSIDLSTAEGLSQAIQRIVDAVAALTNIASGILDAWEPFARAIGNSIDSFAQSGSAAAELVGKIAGLGAAVNKIAGAFQLLTGALTAIATVQVGTAIANIGSAMAGAIPAATSLATWLGGAGIAGAAGYAAGTLMNEYVPGVKSTADAMTDWIFKQSDHYEKLQESDVKYQEAIKNMKELRESQEGVTESSPEVDLKTASFEQNLEKVNSMMDRWEYEEAMKKLTIDTRGVEDAMESIDWNAIENELIDVWGDGPALTVATTSMYRWKDKNGGEHFTDTPPDPDEVFGDIEEIKAPIRAEVNEGSIREAKRKIKQEFAKASVTPVGVNIQVDGTGVGPAFQSGINDYFKTNPIQMDDIFDPGSLSELFDALENAKDPATVAKIQKAIDQALELQEKLGTAQTKYLNGQSALLQQQWDLFYMQKSTSEQGGTIKIDASGLEPEMESFMWRLLKLIQVRANESGAEFLLAAAS